MNKREKDCLAECHKNSEELRSLLIVPETERHSITDSLHKRGRLDNDANQASVEGSINKDIWPVHVVEFGLDRHGSVQKYSVISAAGSRSQGQRVENIKSVEGITAVQSAARIQNIKERSR